jgi:hypothetical protein
MRKTRLASFSVQVEVSLIRRNIVKVKMEIFQTAETDAQQSAHAGRVPLCR